MQREFFRKRQKDESFQHFEATVQDSIFEKLESESMRRKKNELIQCEPNLMAKASVTKVCSQTRPNLPLGKSVASQPDSRKKEHPTPLKPQGYGVGVNSIDLKSPFQAAASSMQCTQKIDNFFKSKVPLTTLSALPHDETQGMQTRRDRPLGKPIAHQKPIATAQPTRATRPNDEHLTLSKSQGLRMSSMDFDIQVPFQPAAPSMLNVLHVSNSSKSKIYVTPSSVPQDNDTKSTNISALSASLHINGDVSKPQDTIFEDINTKIKKSSDKKPNVFIDASTQCGFAPDFSGLKFENSYQTLEYQLPANFSQLPRLLQHIMS